MMIFGQPQWKDIELVIAGEHGVEGREIAKCLLHHLRTRIHKYPMHRGNDVAELVRTRGRQKQTKRKLALGFLVGRTDNLAEVIDVIVGSFRSRARIKRRAIPPAHYTLQNTNFEERDELLLGVDLAASCRC